VHRDEQVRDELHRGPVAELPDIVNAPGHRAQDRLRLRLGGGGAAQVGNHVFVPGLATGPGQRAVEQHGASFGKKIAGLLLNRHRERGGLDDNPARMCREFTGDVVERLRGGQRGDDGLRVPGNLGGAGGAHAAAIPVGR
jgi:hypothetical protein